MQGGSGAETTCRHDYSWEWWEPLYSGLLRNKLCVLVGGDVASFPDSHPAFRHLQQLSSLKYCKRRDYFREWWEPLYSGLLRNRLSVLVGGDVASFPDSHPAFRHLQQLSSLKYCKRRDYSREWWEPLYSGLLRNKLSVLVEGAHSQTLIQLFVTCNIYPA